MYSSYNWKFVKFLTAFIQFFISQSPTSGNHKTDIFFCKFVFEVLLMCSIMLVPVTQKAIQHFYIFQNDNHYKCSYETSPYKDMAWLLNISFIPFISYAWFIYLAIGSLYLLNLLHLFLSSPPPSFPLETIYMFFVPIILFLFYLCSFFFFFKILYLRQPYSICLSWFDLFHLA